MNLRNFFSSINTVLSALQYQNEDAFKWVDLYNNQLEKKEFELNTTDNDEQVPAALIQLKNSEFIHLKNNIQRGTLEICIHIADRLFDNNGKSLGGGSRALNFFDRVALVHNALHNLQIEDFSPLVRLDAKQSIDDDKGKDNTDDGFDIVYTKVLTYQTTFTDTSAIKTRTAATYTDIDVISPTKT